MPPERRKRRRLGEMSIPAERRTTLRPDHVLALDFRLDKTVNGRAIKLLNIIDECTREFLAIVVDHPIDADDTVTDLERSVIDRGAAPEFIRCDNGPELTANAFTNCWTTSHPGTHYIDPASPWQNAWIESFNVQRLPSPLRAQHARPDQVRSTITTADSLIGSGPTSGGYPRPCAEIATIGSQTALSALLSVLSVQLLPLDSEVTG